MSVATPIFKYGVMKMSQHLDADSAAFAAMDRQSVLHPFVRLDEYARGMSPDPLVVDRADGLWVYDAKGRKILDAFSALYCVNVGYGRQRIVDAMAEQGARLPYYHVFAGATHSPAAQLAEKLIELTGGRMSKVFFGSSGSDANETQIKLAWYVNNVAGRPQKKKIISRERGYHGGTIMTSSLTGLPAYHQGFDLIKDVVRRTVAPDMFWSGFDDPAAFVRHCVADLEAIIAREGADTIAAFIAEPMIGAGGMVPPPPGYWQAIQQVLRRHDILLILDEVVTAFGRLGEWFGGDLWGIEPDLVTLAKGLTSGYAPLSAVLIGPRVWEALEAGGPKLGAFGHGYTYTAHPTCAAAGLANIAIIEEEDLLANARDVAPYLQAGLEDRLAGHPLVGEIRAQGLALAVEFTAEESPRRHLAKDLKFAGRVFARAVENGLFARTMPHGDIIGLAPAISLTRGEADLIVERLGKAIDEAAATLSPSERRAA
jgi:L-2,4-diaminobutyrate transaminase